MEVECKMGISILLGSSSVGVYGKGKGKGSIYVLSTEQVNVSVKDPKRARTPNLLTMTRQWTYGPTLLPWFDHL